MSGIQRITLISLFCICCSLSAVAQSKYYTYLNQFGSLFNNDTRIERQLLCYNNNTNQDRFNIVQENCKQSAFSCYMRISNKNNKEGKYFKVQESNGKTRKVTDPTWGLVWNYKDSANYYAVVLKGYNTALYDLLDERQLKIQIIQVRNGKEYVMSSTCIIDDVDVYDGFNIICVKYDGKKTRVYTGNHSLKLIEELNDIEYSDSINVGFLAGAGAKIEMERLVFKRALIPEEILTTDWDKATIDKYLANNVSEEIEGLWEYLDRNLDERIVKLGGKYKIAIVKNNQNGYDILYYSGAVVNPDKWKCGMLKGVLTKTKFRDNYNLIWYDSSMDGMDDDTYVSIDENDILTAVFPTEKAQIRFVKQ